MNKLLETKSQKNYDKIKNWQEYILFLKNKISDTKKQENNHNCICDEKNLYCQKYFELLQKQILK